VAWNSYFAGNAQGKARRVFCPVVSLLLPAPAENGRGGTGYLFVLGHLEKLLFRPISASQRKSKSSHMTNMLRF
jgi:hypothetical protein